ncbi:hypothetical protein RHMOL_Rhmol01G0188400 [Rhododendron molle]|uniref:Uncharacterized protein n=1 Tax=Rhododendron molle TaxID=49168 RepID=A0ACC0Q2P9_RHOML|nr:hypothetical protein RHMOL_Rhmol01G0188400 [Rhododendron molle]
MQKDMIMMVENMQEISNKLQTKRAPHSEQPKEETPATNPNLVALLAKIYKLEESIQKTKWLGKGEIDMNKLCLFPNATLPEEFKSVDFAKFDGTGDPKAHLQGKRTWEDIGTAFVAQYDFNVDLKMTTRELESTKTSKKESFANFVKRWRAKAAQMQNKADLKEQIRIITKNVPSSFAPYMGLSHAALNFETFYDFGLAVEEAFWDGTLEKKETGSKSNRANSGNNNVLFGNTNQAGTLSAKPVEVNQIFDKPKSQNRAFTQFSTLRSTLLKKLTEIGVLKPLLPPQTIPPNLNQSVYCEFHQMPGHTTDNCICLHREIQNLINNKENTWGNLIFDWEDFEAANFQRVVELPFEPGWEVDWQNIHADPLDGLSLYIMFESQDENYQIPQEAPKWEWDPIPDTCPLLAMGDPLDMFSLSTMFAEEYQPEVAAYSWPELAPLHPDFSHFNDFVVDKLYNNVGLTSWYLDLGPPELEEEVTSSEFNPIDYIVDEAESEPSVTFPEDANVAMMNLWEDEPGAKTSPWANSEIVNIKVGNEEWIVNKAVMEAEQWKPEDLWEDLVIADLIANLRDTTIGGKRKALIDLWRKESKYYQGDHLTRCGCIYHPSNLRSENPLTLQLHQPKNLPTLSLP